MSSSSKCRYYSNGYCSSPLAMRTFGDRPSREPVDLSKCMGNFRECKYYVETQIVSELEMEFSRDYYPLVNYINCDNSSECPFYSLKTIDKENNICVAYCIVSEKYLTKLSIRKCIEYWRDCPFYKLGLELTA
ncbi:MAG: hypothetical protein QXO78_05135 [Desulfurococcaceae archaeon]